MDLMVFMPKAPVSLSAQIQMNVTNKEYSGATLTNNSGSGRRYFIAGFSVDDLESMGLTDSTQLSQLRSMDDAGSIDLATFESDPDHIGFVLTSDLHTVIHNARDDLQKLKHAPWTIFEIKDALSETPFEGSLDPLTMSDGTIYKVAFGDLPDYFEHVVTTGELKPRDYMEGDKKMPNNNQEFTDEQLQAMLAGPSGSDFKSMDLAIEEKKSLEEELFEDGEEYYQEQVRREEAERLRKEAEARQRKEAERQRIEQDRKRREQEAQAKAAAAAQNGAVFIPNLKSFKEIVQDLNIQPDTDVERFYLSNLDMLAEYADSMNIEASVFNAFDPQGRRDLMIAMNREREKLVNQALVQLKREAMVAEEQTNIDSENASVAVREKHLDLYMKPLEERQAQMREKMDEYAEERQQLLEDGFKEWYARVENDPESVYKEIYQKSMVDDAIEKEKDRLNHAYRDYRSDREKELDAFIGEFIAKRRERDLSHLRLDWSEAARLGAQTLNDRVDSARSQMESRRMVVEMRRMYEQIEEQSTKQMQTWQQSIAANEAQVSRPSQASAPEGTVQQSRPEPRIQAPNAPEQRVEQPKVEPVARVVPNTPPAVERPAPVDEEVFEDNFPEAEDYPEAVEYEESEWNEEEFVDDTYNESYDDSEATVASAPQPTAPQPVISRPRDVYPSGSQQEEDPWDEFEDADMDDSNDEWDDDELLDDLPDEVYEDDDFADEDDDWDDEELDDSEVAKKPRKKGLRGLFGKR